ncbi:unnamed protein product [Polarella glacialis]|uniref:Uncharacterized protein n=1 Tax=Polarella glacialis TaxID=89957 RepID=A0A813M6H3_POLGL|nr:unnamed protein product [Polarella glacialis]CAE8742118.1 unnamed protein product [Polarella glacialis]
MVGNFITMRVAYDRPAMSEAERSAPASEQQLQHFQVAITSCLVSRCLAVVVHSCEVSACLSQQLQHFQVIQSCMVSRCPAVIGHSCEVSACLSQQLQHF